MLDLNELVVFARVADSLSFGKAARALGLPASTVSRKIDSLERRLGVALLYRNTRQVRLTEAGTNYHQHCLAVIAAADEAEAAISPHREDLRGELRINASVTFGQGVLAPIAAEFAVRHPHLCLRIALCNNQVAPVGDGFELVIAWARSATHPCALAGSQDRRSRSLLLQPASRITANPSR